MAASFLPSEIESGQVTELRSLLHIVRGVILMMAGLCGLGVLAAMVAKPRAFGLKGSRKSVVLTILFWLSVIAVGVIWQMWTHKLKQP